MTINHLELRDGYLWHTTHICICCSHERISASMFMCMLTHTHKYKNTHTHAQFCQYGTTNSLKVSKIKASDMKGRPRKH